ncbi:MAG TPA: TIM barrel protein [Phycisphaerae bacterium]|nr:sugar phosphate isomerase/epimerase [Phycisphaerae bacterium]HOI56824.1 TIM barrel protein [Phycisphaerae bacterium]
MYLTGFADEAGVSVEAQIRATRELGWHCIEARKIDGETNIHDIDQDQFVAACDKLDAAGVRVNCFGSAIANWAKQITDPFEVTLAEVSRAIPRMQRLGCKLIRVMSYAVLKDRGPDDQMESERFRRMRELQKRFGDAGLTMVHENCMNYGGMGWTYTMKLVENVPGLKLVYDTGNPVTSDDRTQPAPYPKQSSWEFYRHVKDHVAYVHIKDGRFDAATGKMVYTFAGEGDGDVRRIVKDLLDGGYDGGFSMEPHLAVVHHDAGVQASARVRFDNYVEYGRRFMALVRELGYGDKLA